VTIEPIDVRDLIGHPGASRTKHVRGTLEGLGTEVASLGHDEAVDGVLLLECVVEGILVSGPIRGTVHFRCARCLIEFDRPLAVEVHELFTRRPDEGGDEADAYVLDPGGWLEPEQMVRDAVGVELPFSPLCRPDCLGICDVCGGDRNLGECPGHEEIDPRWVELERLLEPSGE
jgi:DUF177 domain-containing protein